MVFNVGGVEDKSILEGLLNFHTCLGSGPQAGDWSLAKSVPNVIASKDTCTGV